MKKFKQTFSWLTLNLIKKIPAEFYYITGGILTFIILLVSMGNEMVRTYEENKRQYTNSLIENDKIIHDYVYNLPIEQVKELYNNIPKEERTNILSYNFYYDNFTIPELTDFNLYVLSSIDTIYPKESQLAKTYFFIVSRVNSLNNKYSSNKNSKKDYYRGKLPLESILIHINCSCSQKNKRLIDINNK